MNTLSFSRDCCTSALQSLVSGAARLIKKQIKIGRQSASSVRIAERESKKWLPPEAAEIQREQNTKPLSGRVEQGQAQFARRRRSRDCTRSTSQKSEPVKVKFVLGAIWFRSPTNETETKRRGLRSMRPERVPENRGSVLFFCKTATGIMLRTAPNGNTE